MSPQLAHLPSWDVEGVETLDRSEWYLVLANHQSWVDIAVLQRIFHRKIPFLKFFIKKELLWLPILGHRTDLRFGRPGAAICPTKSYPDSGLRLRWGSSDAFCWTDHLPKLCLELVRSCRGASRVQALPHSSFWQVQVRPQHLAQVTV